MYQEPDPYPRGSRHQYQQGRQGQCVPVRHGQLCRHELGLYAVLGRRQAMPDVCLLIFPMSRMNEMLTSFRCVAVKTLPLNTDVEIECIAVL